MFKRFTMIAVLGFILSVVFAGTAQAEIYLVSPSSAELPTVVTLASDEPDLTAGCSQGMQDANNNGLVIPATASEAHCGMYPLGMTGPDANGLYYYNFRLFTGPPGQVIMEGFYSGSGSESYGKGFPFTITGNRFKYGDFGTCIDVRSSLDNYQALIAYFAQISTEVVFQVEWKRRQGNAWVWERGTTNRQVIEIGRLYQPYARHYVRFRIPPDLLPPKQAHYDKRLTGHYKRYTEHLARASYVIKHGSEILKKGYLAARKPCQELSSGAVQP